MPYIKRLTIRGFKRFEELDIEFNKSTNIIVGENEKGKSTILEAISIILNQKYRNSDKYIIQEMLNVNQIQRFKSDPSVKTLPSIYMELEISMNLDDPNSKFYHGCNNFDAEAKFGIKFECSFDTEFQDDLHMEIEEGNIPYEYYKLNWETFHGGSYKIFKKPINIILIDNTASDSSSSFNYYNKSLFYSQYDNAERLKVKNNFRNEMSEVFSNLGLDELRDGKRFGVNSKKVVFENIITIFDNDIPLENKGKGLENIIKTRIALDREKSKLDTIMIEEPENHLSHSNLLKMIKEINEKAKDSQLIITTHSNMIVSRLNLNNVIWLSEENKATKLDNVDKKVAEFFIKADDNKFLQLLLSEKVILVEGATEYLLIPKFFKQIIGKDISESGISVISCSGISYNHYLEIARSVNKKVAVITDNDKSMDKILKSKDFNSSNANQKIFLDKDIENWTWEVCFYNLNKEYFDINTKLQEGAEYKFNGEFYGKVLGKMLNNKVNSAYEMLISDHKFKVPEYVEDAIKWIAN